MANRPEPEAGRVLQHLVANRAPSHVDTARRAPAVQRKARRDSGHVIATVEGLRTFMMQTPEGLDGGAGPGCRSDCDSTQAPSGS